MSNLKIVNDKFLRLVDVMEFIDKKVSFIGVVTEVGIPKQSRGTDYCCTLRIVDESHGISIIFFAETFEKLPRVESAGDIIQLSNVMARLHESEVNAVCYKQFSSFALYKGIDGSSFVPYQVSSKFHGREQDNKFISNLRNWAFSHQHGTVSTDSLLLREIRQGTGFNLICKVVHICEVREGEWMVFVWDGTDAPPLNVEGRRVFGGQTHALTIYIVVLKHLHCCRLEEELKNPIPLQLEASPLSREVLCGFPSVGTVLRMTTDPCSERQLGLHTLKAATGKWVHFKNIKFDVCCGLWCGILLSATNKYEKRYKGQWTRMPCSSFRKLSRVTETDHQKVPFDTLMDMLTHQEVMYKFRCVVRVVATFPAQPSDFRDPCGNYVLRLTLEDPTARIHAYLYDEYGV
ncbi:hypothetical protein L1887_25892 [Cichorium endivia]|nr:hypothetical protein L1887_25892 [Cichorium endivia]